MGESFCWQDEKELMEDNCCPIHRKPCAERKEDNYFFALSKYQQAIDDLLTSNPNFVRPSFRLNEVKESEGHCCLVSDSQDYLLACVRAVLLSVLV